MPSKKSKGRSDSSGATPKRRSCATDEVHERLLRTSPGYAEARAAVENHCWRSREAKMAGRTGCTLIPVVVHVIYNTPAQNISDAQIESQIDVLNLDYRKTNADLSNLPGAFSSLPGDVRVEFVLASEDPDGNPHNGIVRVSTNKSSFPSDDSMKFSSSGGSDAWPRDRYLNLWVCQLGGGLLGYAQFPGGPANTDGVVILNTAFGTTGTAAAPFDKGRTATHEIGHWLNLRHIWGDDGTGCSGSDFVGDTPNQAGPNYGTPSFPHVTCGNGPDGDLFMNYMDYVDDQAMYMFTAGQVDRMQAALDGPRSTIGTQKPCEGEEPPTLKFLDEPTTTLKYLDEPTTTLKFLDEPKSKISDEPTPTLKFFDDGTFFGLDPYKLPGYDKMPFGDLMPGGGLGWVGQPGGRSATPFVLSTPHHSSAWMQSFPGAAQSRAAAVAERLNVLRGQLSAASQADAQGRLGAADRAKVEELFAEFEKLRAELAELTGADQVE